MSIKITNLSPELARMLEQITANIETPRICTPSIEEIKTQIARCGALAGAAVLADDNPATPAQALEAILGGTLIACAHVLASLKAERIPGASRTVNESMARAFDNLGYYTLENTQKLIELSAREALDYSEAKAAHEAAQTLAATVERMTTPGGNGPTH